MGADKPDGPKLAAVEPQPGPVVTVAFEAPGSAGFTVTMPSITPGQVYALATYFENLAGAIFAGQLAERVRGGLVVPPPGGLAGLGGRSHG